MSQTAQSVRTPAQSMSPSAEPDKPPQRPRFPGGDALEQLIREYVGTPNCIDYSESLKKAKVDIGALLRHARFLIGLQQLQFNMSFSQRSMERALRSVAVHNRTSWKLTASEEDRFAQRVATRIRVMCAHFSQACRRSKPPRWVNKIKAISGSRRLDSLGRDSNTATAPSAASHSGTASLAETEPMLSDSGDEWRMSRGAPRS